MISNRPVSEMVERLVRDAYEEGVEDGAEWATDRIMEPRPQWIDSVARVNTLTAAIPSAGGVEEPTEAMIEAGAHELMDYPEREAIDVTDAARKIYLAMARAALESTSK